MIPKKLENAPILLSAVSIKFETDLPSQAIFGIFYQAIKESFGNFQSNPLPILNIPIEIREQDENLKFAPEYILINNDKRYTIQIGGRNVALVYDRAYGYEYPGWNNYLKQEAEKLVDCIFKMGIIKTISIEYQNIDFFEDDIFDKINITINDPIQCSLSQISCTKESDSIVHHIAINNKGRVVIQNNQKVGSIIDIKTLNKDTKIDKKDVIDVLDAMHNENKELFFKIIKKEYIDAKFKPEYQ
ncbi:TIGR04255 family protein [Campylobacter sp. MOP7]|uniref:TIGR04255 family protein n=1 Tax=Campylobacter canis TaxID=3378588 RepID=UPI00387E6B20